MLNNLSSKTPHINEVFQAMDKLSKRPFEYFVSGICFILMVFGLFGHPGKSITQEELWAISIFGGISLISALIIAIKKLEYTMKTNLEKIEYKKFMADQKTKRLQIRIRPDTDPDLSDLESF